MKTIDYLKHLLAADEEKLLIERHQVEVVAATIDNLRETATSFCAGVYVAPLVAAEVSTMFVLEMRRLKAEWSQLGISRDNFLAVVNLALEGRFLQVSGPES